MVLPRVVMYDPTRKQRKARWKVRETTGACFARVDVPGDFVHRLIERGLLVEQDAENPQALGEAVAKYLLETTSNENAVPPARMM